MGSIRVRSTTPPGAGMARTAVGVVAMLFTLAASGGATHTVCPAGCDFTTIQGAVNAAGAGDRVDLLVAGSHTENGIMINKSLTISGLGKNLTIVQAAATQGTAPTRVFFITSGHTIQFLDLTIRHGNVSLEHGGGIFNQGSEVTLTNVSVVANRAFNGAGIYHVAGTLALGNASIRGNVAQSNGGGVYINSGPLDMSDSEITQNQCGRSGCGIYSLGDATIQNGEILQNATPTPGSGFAGAGMYVGGGTLIVTDSVIAFNHLRAANLIDLGPGGVFFHGTEFQLLNSTVASNTGSSGGLYLAGGKITISQSVIADNQAYEAAGILQIDPAVLIMTDSTIRGNVADRVGGGASIYGDDVEIRDSTIADNEAQLGGGIYFSHSGEVPLVSVTVSGNRAEFDGGGVYVANDAEVSLASVTITANQADSDADGSGDGGGIFLAAIGMLPAKTHPRNTIVAGNLDLSPFPNVSADDCFGTIDSQGYNLIGALGTQPGRPPCLIAGDTTGNQVGVDAMLGPLADNGGPTETHALLPGSPAINAGNPAGCTDPDGEPLPTDQRGGPRVGRCDIGAHEFDALPIFSDSFEEP